MAKFQMLELLSEDANITARFGAGTGLSNNFKDSEVGKCVKYVADSRFDLCVAGDPIEGFVVSVESATLDGYTIGSYQAEDRMTCTADGLQATPGTGTIAVGDYVVAGTVDALFTAIPGTRFVKVCKATWQPGTSVPAAFADCASIQKVATYAWRVVSITSGTGVVGDVLVIERINR